MAITLPSKSTALILIDLQTGILSQNLQPLPAAELLAASLTLATRFRAAGSAVVPVNVSPLIDPHVYTVQQVDAPMQLPPGGFPDDWAELAAGVAMPGDIRITKRFWGAFFGTELDYQLRRRAVQTVVICGVSTNVGVETTARQAYELGYNVIIATDAVSSSSTELHESSLKNVMPRIARLMPAADITLGAA